MYALLSMEKIESGEGTETETIARSRQEIDAEYTKCAANLGDRLFKMKLMDLEARQIQEKMCALIQESSAVPKQD